MSLDLVVTVVLAAFGLWALLKAPQGESAAGGHGCGAGCGACGPSFDAAGEGRIPLPLVDRPQAPEPPAPPPSPRSEDA